MKIILKVAVFPMKALYYDRLDDNLVRCTLCPRECVIKSGKRGFCRAKENRSGELYSRIYAELSSIAMDPIEKKPLYHFYPGSQILSIGTVGCNLSCKFCQNWQISQVEAKTRRIKPEILIEQALHFKAKGIAYTYSEPMIWYEYILETSKKARQNGLTNVLVTNGVINQEPLKNLLPYIDAINLDVKAFNTDFYADLCGGDYLATVRETGELAAKNCHLEVTTLLVPGLNDQQSEIKNIAHWLASMSSEIPWHLTRYFPSYQLDLPATPVEHMKSLLKIAKEYLDYVYLGNLKRETNNTYCPQCNHPVIKRSQSVVVDLNQGCCPQCGAKISVVLDR